MLGDDMVGGDAGLLRGEYVLLYSVRALGAVVYVRRPALVVCGQVAKEAPRQGIRCDSHRRVAAARGIHIEPQTPR